MAAVLNPFYQQTVKTGRLWPVQMERVKRSRIGEKRRELENSLSHCVFACKLSRSERACLTRAATAAGCISPEIGNFLFSIQPPLNNYSMTVYFQCTYLPKYEQTN